MRDLPARLREARETRGLSYRQAADQIGLTIATLHKIEHGGDPRLSSVTRVLDWLTPSDRPWAENVRPTPEQFADWFVTLPHDEQVRIAGQMLDAEQAAHSCFIQNHRRLSDEVGVAYRRAARYRTAWESARRRRNR